MYESSTVPSGSDLVYVSPHVEISSKFEVLGPLNAVNGPVAGPRHETVTPHKVIKKNSYLFPHYVESPIRSSERLSYTSLYIARLYRQLIDCSIYLSRQLTRATALSTVLRRETPFKLVRFATKVGNRRSWLRLRRLR
jgi:hypothetical protein